MHFKQRQISYLSCPAVDSIDSRCPLWVLLLCVVMLAFSSIAKAVESTALIEESFDWQRMKALSASQTESGKNFSYYLPPGGQYRLALDHFLEPSPSTWILNQIPFYVKNLAADITCDKEIVLSMATLPAVHKKAFTFRFPFVLKEFANIKTSIEISQRDTHCSLEIRDNGRPYKSLHIVPEEDLYPGLSQLRQQRVIGTHTSQEAAETHWSGKVGLEPFRLLKDPTLAFNARIKALLGYELTSAQLAQHDPDMSLDFSRAPHLDLVILSTLVLYDDFTGHLLARLLKYHASRGTPVYFYDTFQYLLTDGDNRKELNFLLSDYPSIKWKAFKYEGETFAPIGNTLEKINRTAHMKVLLTYSHDHPENDSVIAGGRNSSDMYLFLHKPQDSTYTDITGYNGKKAYRWLYFDDLDFESKNPEMTALTAQSILRFIDSDTQHWHFPAVTSTLNENQDSSQAQGQLLLSVPYSDDHALEKAYVQVIQEAKSSVRILSPYLNPTDAILSALRSAKDRGVKVEIITTSSVEKDIAPFVLAPAMNHALRILMRDFVILQYRDPSLALSEDTIVHAKALEVDGQKLFLGSVNLNQRSFIHDVEVSVLVQGTQPLQDFNEMFNTLLGHSWPMTERQLGEPQFMEKIVPQLNSVF